MRLRAGSSRLVNLSCLCNAEPRMLWDWPKALWRGERTLGASDMRGYTVWGVRRGAVGAVLGGRYLVGGLLFDEGEHVIHGADFIFLVKKHRIPADFAIVLGDPWGDALCGQFHADRVIVGDRSDKAQVL